MNVNKKKQVMYKSTLAILLTGILVTGCGKNEEPIQDPTAGEPDIETTQEPEASKDYLPTAIMTPEETNALVEGQYFSADELTKLPDMETLEMRDLSIMYFYTELFTPVDPSFETNNQPIERGIGYAVAADELHTLQKIGSDIFYDDYEFQGIGIASIINYFYDETEDQYMKFIKFEDISVNAGYIVSQDKDQELRGK